MLRLSAPAKPRTPLARAAPAHPAGPHCWKTTGQPTRSFAYSPRVTHTKAPAQAGRTTRLQRKMRPPFPVRSYGTPQFASARQAFWSCALQTLLEAVTRQAPFGTWRHLPTRTPSDTPRNSCWYSTSAPRKCTASDGRARYQGPCELKWRPCRRARSAARHAYPRKKTPHSVALAADLGTPLNRWSMRRLPLCYTLHLETCCQAGRPGPWMPRSCCASANRNHYCRPARRRSKTLFGSVLATSSLLTLFPECFSSFARATCSLSVSGAKYCAI